MSPFFCDMYSLNIVFIGMIGDITKCWISHRRIVRISLVRIMRMVRISLVTAVRRQLVVSRVMRMRGYHGRTVLVMAAVHGTCNNQH